MNINIYEKYKVRLTKEWSTLSEENETIYDNIFEETKNEETLLIDGYKFFDIISSMLKEDYISEFTIVGKEIHFEYFNYNNGENAHICYEILRDKETPKGFKSYEDYKKKEEAFIKHFCKGDKENE